MQLLNWLMLVEEPEVVSAMLPVQEVSFEPPCSTAIWNWVPVVGVIDAPEAPGVGVLKKTNCGEEVALDTVKFSLDKKGELEILVSVASKEKLPVVTPVFSVTVQPVKSTMPFTSGPEQLPRVPLVEETRERITGDESAMTGLPDASSTSTTGWSAASRAEPEAKVADVDGQWMKTSFAGTVPTAPWETVLPRGYSTMN